MHIIFLMLRIPISFLAFERLHPYKQPSILTFKPPTATLHCRYYLFPFFPILLPFSFLMAPVEPEKHKRSPSDAASSPGSKESPSARMEGTRPPVLLLVPRLQLPHPTSGGKGTRHFDTRSLNEENFIASIGVYPTPSPLACTLRSPLAPPCSPV